MSDTNRAEFEHHYANMTGEGFPGSLDGVYDYSYTQMCWLTWQAARAQPERVALSDAQLLAIVDQECASGRIALTCQHDVHGRAPTNIFKCLVRSILSAQADPNRCNSTGLESPITQPLIAEAADQGELTEADACRYHFRGNTVAYMYDKAKAYQAAIGRAFDALRDAGIAPDGRTELSDIIRKAIAAIKRDDVAGDASATLQEVTKLVDDWEGYALSASGDERNGDLCGFIAKLRAAIAASKGAQ